MMHVFVIQPEGKDPIELARSDKFEHLLQLPVGAHIKLPCRYDNDTKEIEIIETYHIIKNYVLDITIPALYVYISEYENNK